MAAATVAATILLPVTIASAYAQEGEAQDSTAQDQPRYLLTPITVTATATPIELFDVARPITVIDEKLIEEKLPNNAADLFRNEQGLDVTGVGANQVRPSIRGQRGQRIVVVQDGMRLNNARRQKDFGEIPALIDISQIRRVEVIRGPASVLYGSDAIGGAVNLVTRTPDREGVHGVLGYRFSTYDTQSRIVGRFFGRSGKFGYQAGGMYRTTDAYEAPSGSFGDITLAENTRVNDTGVQDYSLDFFGSYDFSARHQVFGKYERYNADDAGFGFVDPAAYAPDEPLIEITYPGQKFDKFTAGYSGTELGSAIADRLSVLGYYQSNRRSLELGIQTEFGPPAPPGAGLAIQTNNFTDLGTVGLRVEASKFGLGRVMFTYGADFFNDDSNNTDTTVTVVSGFGPPMVDVDSVPQVPDATYRSVGGFVQGDIQITPAAALILGVRYQNVRAQTRETQGITAPTRTNNYDALVAAANGIYTINNQVALVATAGRAFRAPNIIEQFFDGVTPEGGAIQVSNPDLSPETSFNIDLGVRFRNEILWLEGFYFNNTLFNGIVIEATGDTINTLPVFQNQNVEELRYQGVELSGKVFFLKGFSVGGNYTYLDSENVLDPTVPVGDTYSNKWDFGAGYAAPNGRFWADYIIRHNGERDNALLAPGNPIGSTLPAFTVHEIRGGATLFHIGRQTHRAQLAVTNIFDALYAEFQNAGFFRPEPQRGLLLSYWIDF